MSYEIGLLKYLIKTPLTRVGFFSMYVFGGVVITFINTSKELLSGNFIEAFFEYFIYSAIPPTSISKLLCIVMVGTTVAGLKWYIAMKLR